MELSDTNNSHRNKPQTEGMEGGSINTGATRGGWSRFITLLGARGACIRHAAIFRIISVKGKGISLQFNVDLDDVDLR